MIYEQRIYEAMPGRLPDLLKRFNEITLVIWDRLGIRQAGFWTVLIGESSNQLIYLLEWESMAERERVWGAFMADQEWIQKKAGTEVNGPLTSLISNQFLQPTSFSKVK